MSHLPHRLSLSISVFLLVFLVLTSMPGISEEAKNKAKKPEKEMRMSSLEHRKRWEKLSEEERDKLKAALRGVWSDPDVLSAREEVNEATQAFQEAIRVAIAKADPAVADLLKEVQASGRGPLSGRPSGRHGGAPGQRRVGEPLIAPPAFLEKMTPEERSRFREVETKARDSEAVSAIRKELQTIQKEDEQLRRKRMETYRKLRKAVLVAMEQEDPSLGKQIAKLSARKGAAGGKGKSRGKGKKGAKEVGSAPSPSQSAKSE